jgi:alkylated DNA repair dioxygenase AlkB
MNSTREETASLQLFHCTRVFHRYDFYTGHLPTVLEDRARSCFESLWSLHPAQSNEILIHGKMVAIPRWQQAYGRNYQFSGTVSEAFPVPEILAPFLGWVRDAIDPRLNGLLLNWYEAARGHYIGAHRDSRQGLIDGSPIVTISVGDRRVFRLRHPKEQGFIDFDASHGAVFVMPWETNLNVKHEVPKSAKPNGRRISITARAFTS